LVCSTTCQLQAFQWLILFDEGMRRKVYLSREQAEKIPWRNSKRLMEGNLVCLSSDNFSVSGWLLLSAFANSAIGPLHAGTCTFFRIYIIVKNL